MRRAAFALAIAAILGPNPPAPADGPKPPSPPSPAAALAPGTRRALVVCGLPGDAEHRAGQAKAVETLARALVERCGFRAEDVWVRFGTEPADGDGPAVRKSRGPSTREAIAADAEALRKASRPEDGLWVFALGHGHYDGRRSHLNLPGPDLDAAAFARLWAGVAAGEQVFVVATPASGFFVRPLAAPGRVVIAATEADREVNETLYAAALADVLLAPPADADRDKDGTLTLFELYLAVAADTFRRYVEDELIPTEHPQLDDNGDGRGTELQVAFPPPGSEAEATPPADGDAKAAPAPAPPKKPEPTLTPRDDGHRSARIRVHPQPPQPAPPATPPRALP